MKSKEDVKQTVFALLNQTHEDSILTEGSLWDLACKITDAVTLQEEPQLLRTKRDQLIVAFEEMRPKPREDHEAWRRRAETVASLLLSEAADIPKPPSPTSVPAPAPSTQQPTISHYEIERTATTFQMAAALLIQAVDDSDEVRGSPEKIWSALATITSVDQIHDIFHDLNATTSRFVAPGKEYAKNFTEDPSHPVYIERLREVEALALSLVRATVGGRRTVMQDWTQQLTLMQQSVLIAAVRGPDGIRKDHPVKVLCRWLRRSFLMSAFDRRVLSNPYEPGGGSFTGPCSLTVDGNFHAWPMQRRAGMSGWFDAESWSAVGEKHPSGLEKAMELYLRSVDELPHHFQLHFLHAAEILGYKHPDATIREWWYRTYLKLVNDAHLQPEPEPVMDKRLGDNESAWRSAEEVSAK